VLVSSSPPADPARGERIEVVSALGHHAQTGRLTGGRKQSDALGVKLGFACSHHLPPQRVRFQP
jgi:hypothetical protein